MSTQRTSTSDLEQTEADSSLKVASNPRLNLSRTSPSRARRAETWKARILIFGALIVAAVVSAVHHVFLYILDGKNVEEFAVPQSWVRDIGNAFSGIVQFLLGLCVGAVLTQSVWSYARRNRVTLNDLDTLFSLPNISTLPSARLRGRALHIFLLVLVFQALSLVGVFAPNALSVVPADPTSSDLIVPVPSLDRIPATTSSYFLKYNFGCDTDDSDSGSLCQPLYTYMNPSAKFLTLARSVLDGGAIFPWSPPLGCGKGCSYEVEYWGPAAQCTEIPQSSIGMYAIGADDPGAPDPSVQVSNATHFLESEFVYNATTSFGYGNNGSYNGVDLIPSFQSYPYRFPFSLDVVYATNNFSLPFSAKNVTYYNITGYTCAFHNASYSASVAFLNGSQTTTVRIVEYGDQLGPLPIPNPDDIAFQTGGAINASQVSGSDADFLATYAALGLSDALSQYVFGTISFTTNSENDRPILVPAYTSVLNSVFTTAASFAGSDLQSTDASNTLSLSLASSRYDNLGRLLEDACVNLTASLMSDTANLGLTRTVSAIVTPDHNIYRYQPLRLWLAYGVAFAITFLVNAYGLFCMSMNGGAMQGTFSSIVASGRNPDLDTLLNDPGEPLPAHAEKVLLHYRVGDLQGEGAGFAIIDGVGGADFLEETSALKDEERI